MVQRILILGGQGRIGSAVAADLLQYTQTDVTITGRSFKDTSEQTQPRCHFIALELADHSQVEAAIADHDLVIHCAGPFRYRDDHVLQSCIRAGVPYLDVADNPGYVQQLQTHQEEAQAAGVTAIASTGIFPGISNSMVLQGVEQLEEAETVHLSYVVAGSGGAGVTVMRTTFIELQHPFPAWIDNQWQTMQPYSDREVIEFPAPFGRCGVYWFHTIEARMLPASFPVKTLITKFGSVPDVYNHMTWMMAHWLPKGVLRSPATVEFLAKVSHRMTEMTERFSGNGVAMRLEIKGQKADQPARYLSTFVHLDTAIAAGAGTGSVAQLVLSGQLHKPGVWMVEQALSTDLFLETLQQRGLEVQQQVETPLSV
ncbi:MAG: saccharopine dehydrogenase NADP-binding domain-containing protein [Elainellaceae cyanobacterium]